MKTVSIILFVALIGIYGCGESRNRPPLRSRHAIVEMRKGANTNEYVSAAREYLSGNRDDMIAADIMTIYAQLRMTNEFRSFGIEYATNSPSLLLEFADIANNASWGSMRDEFALETAKKPNASYSELFRSARFVLQGGIKDVSEDLLKRLAQKATKRYQMEDLQLMTCEIAIRRSEASQVVAEMLARLANEAMMPQVRRDAKKMLSEIKIVE